MTSGVSADADILPAEVWSFLNSNPPHLDWTYDTDARPDLEAPSIFYERHLDARLMLRQVQVIPIESLLSQVVDRSLTTMASKGISFSDLGGGDSFNDLKFAENSGLANNAAAVGKIYNTSTARHCHTLASTILFHPQARQWDSSLEWGDITNCSRRFVSSLNCYGLQIYGFDFLSRSLKEVIDNETRDLMKTLGKPRHPLAWWELFFFDDEARSLLADVDRIAGAGVFHGSCRTYGYRTPAPTSFHVSLDALHTPWGLPLSSLYEILGSSNQSDVPVSFAIRDSGHAESRNTRSRTRILSRNEDKKSPRKTKSQRQPVLPVYYDTTLWPEVRPEIHKSKPMDLFLLRAWAQSVTYDTTFIIFHCGNFERIGFRHRESQTLFVSDLIDVHNCSNPAYGRLHTGLYLSIVQDAINRLKEQNARNTAKPRTRKRRRESYDMEPTNRRYKTRSTAAKNLEASKNFKVVKHHALERLLALVTLRFDNYNSMCPASFLRSGASLKNSYGPNEYMSIVLTSEIASGAVGVAFHAQLELLINGFTKGIPAVFKLAFKAEQITKMRHEYSIYQHLYKNGVTDGIPTVFGIFDDIETGASALVMSFVGESLCTLKPRYTDPGNEAPEAIKNAYVHLLEEIHRAGVCHGDIREENLTLTDEDKVAIIDFDRAKLHPSDKEMQAELVELSDHLHGDMLEEEDEEDNDAAIDPVLAHAEQRKRRIPHDIDAGQYWAYGKRRGCNLLPG